MKKITSLLLLLGLSALAQDIQLNSSPSSFKELLNNPKKMTYIFKPSEESCEITKIQLEDIYESKIRTEKETVYTFQKLCKNINNNSECLVKTMKPSKLVNYTWIEADKVETIFFFFQNKKDCELMIQKDKN